MRIGCSFLSHVSPIVIGLNSADASVLSSTVATFQSNYKTQVNDLPAGSTQTAINNRESLVAAARATLSQNLSPSGFLTLDGFVQAHKGGISISSASPMLGSAMTADAVSAATAGSGSFTFSHFEGTNNPADSQAQGLLRD